MTRLRQSASARPGAARAAAKRLLPLFFLLLAACAGRPPQSVAPLPAMPPALAPPPCSGEIVADTVWEGRVVIDGVVNVARGVTLTIRPGTEISFLRRDDDRDGFGDGALIVAGSLHAEGTRARPIRFHSAAARPQPGDWQEIRADSSSMMHLRWCEIRDSSHGLHADRSQGYLEDCRIHRNFDGCLLDLAHFTVRNCLLEENEGVALHLRKSPAEVARNIIRYNETGILLSAADRDLRFRANNIHGNNDNFRLGDPPDSPLRLDDNWWGPAEGQAAETRDAHDPHDGRVSIVPAPAWMAGSGPRDRLTLREAWRFEAGGFIDAGPTVAGDSLYVSSWDGHLYALDRGGKLLWRRDFGDVLDAPPAVARGVLFLHSWQREVYALDQHDGREIWRFTYAPSADDHHRQGGVLRAGELLLVPAWNGSLYALDAITGVRLWQGAAGPPLRAAPVAAGERIYQASGSGLLSAWTFTGASLWQRDLGAPLLAPPAVTPAGPVAVSRDGLLIAFDPDGQERWRRQLGEECIYGGPLYDGRYLYLGTAAGTLWKLEAASGRTIWRFPASGPLYARPLLTDGRLIVGDNSARLLVIGADSGDLLASFRAEGEIQGTPARLGNQIVFGSRDHRVYALEMVGEEGDGSAAQVPRRE